MNFSDEDIFPPHETFMSEALRQAEKAFKAEEVPVGAVIVHEGNVIARAHNQVELLKDATAHAEMLAITQAQAALGDWRLLECTLYVTKEPCPMCAGAIMLSRIEKVIFGIGDPKMGAMGGAYNLFDLPQINHRTSCQGDVCAEKSLSLLKSFFQKNRPSS